jgi:type I restriction enzyme R subunit
MRGDISKPERETQDRVIRLFRDTLKYNYLGDWDERDNNSNIEEGIRVGPDCRGNTEA